MLECRILTSESEVHRLAEDWRRLQKTTANSPFTTFEWFDAWWEHIGKPAGKRLHIAVGFLNGDPAAILPLVVMHRSGLRILQGIGLEAFFISDMLVTSAEHAKALWDAVRQSRLYDFAMIRDVEAQSLCSQALAAFARQGDVEKSPCVAVQWKSGNEWMASLPKKIQHEHRRHVRRMEEQGGYTLHVHTAGPIPTDILAGMIRHKTEWCAKNGKRGLFDQHGVTAFFDQLLKDTFVNGTLFLAWLTCGEAVVSYNLGFKHKQAFYDYFVTYNPAWMALSPGNVILENTIAWSMDNGFREFNFLQGEGRYKSRLTNSSRDYIEWVFAPSLSGSIKGRLYIALRALRRKIKGR